MPKNFKKLHEFKRKSFAHEPGEIFDYIHELYDRMVDFVPVANKLMELILSHRKTSFIFIQLIQKHLKTIL